MIGLILELLLKIGLIILVLFICQKFGVFKVISKFFSFLNKETHKKHSNKLRIEKFKAWQKRTIKRCDEL
jgi:hypothetical protein